MFFFQKYLTETPADIVNILFWGPERGCFWSVKIRKIKLDTMFDFSGVGHFASGESRRVAELFRCE